MTERFGFRVVAVHPGLVTSDYDVHEVGVTVCGVQHVLGVRVRPETRRDESTKHYFTQMLLLIN